MPEKHDPARMVFTDRYSKKHQVSGRRGTRYWNWWYNGYRCPVCGAFRSRLANLDKSRRMRDPVCDGSGRQPKGEPAEAQ
jgi:hypothetical protein